MEKIKLRNGHNIPVLCVGTNRMDEDKMTPIVEGAIEAGIRFFDSARDYGNEYVVGEVIKKVVSKYGLQRSDLYLTTKVGNSQQLAHNMRAEITQSLANLQTDYVDVWLLHWPYPNFYEENLKQMHELKHEGKARAVGIANPRLRHLQRLQDLGIELPDVIQIEHHPFRLQQELLDFCYNNNIQVEAYSPLCFMIDKLRTNTLLNELASKYGKTLGQIVLRWHYQHHVIPVFRSENPKRFMENANIFDFSISLEDMRHINSLDEDFKFIPESLHCSGY